MHTTLFQTEDLSLDYDVLLRQVIDYGKEVSSQGQLTREVRPFVLELSEPMLSVVRRKGFNHGLMWMEIAQVLGGQFDRSLYAQVTSGQTLNLLTEGGAYGPRVRIQLPLVAHELEQDPDSRRAVVYIGRPDDLTRVLGGQTTDMPYTTTWQFFVRSGVLEMHVSMRSWDLVERLLYDVPVFVSVQLAMARALGIGVGRYLHVAGSAYVHERYFDMEPAREFGRSLPTVAAPRADHGAVKSIETTISLAQQTLHHAGLRNWQDISPVWSAATKAWSTS